MLLTLCPHPYSTLNILESVISAKDESVMFHSRPCSKMLPSLAVTTVKAEYVWLSSHVADQLVSHPDCNKSEQLSGGQANRLPLSFQVGSSALTAPGGSRES